MKIRNFSLIFLLFISASFVRAQDKRTVSSKLNDVTVFFRGAELTHTANAPLTKGDNEIFIEGISSSVDINSVRIKATNSVVVSAYEYSIDYLSSGKSITPLLKKIEDSISIHRMNLERVNIDLKINANMISYLQTGITKNVSGSEKGLGIDELVKTMDYYKSKSEEMETAQSVLNKKKVQLETTINRLQSQLNQELVKGNKTSGVLKLNLSSPMSANTTFTITYFTPSAGWVPYYDIKIRSTDKPIVIAAKSKVTQTSGFDWEKVKLTLSTATPSNGKVAPLLSTWFLQQIQLSRMVPDIAAASQNSYAYEDMKLKEVVASGYVSEKKDLRNAPAPKSVQAPLYIVNGSPVSPEQFASLDQSMIKSTNIIQDASATALYGSRGENGVIVVTLKDAMDDYVSESDSEMNVVYNIDLPYTIPGNGKVQNIDLMTKETPALYKYYCAPKLDGETYLLAEVSGWEKLGLLSGKANLTYDGTHVGETYINASSIHEKLTLTLGTDKRVAVKREKMTDFSSSKALGSDIQKIFTYKITVKNNQNQVVKMVLKDQYPISTQKNIEVLLRKETTPWTANKEDLGVISWEEEFAPGETKTYMISYSVKYPKDMNLNL